MKTCLMTLATLTLTSAALACPAQQGTLGNGLMPAIAGMRAECGPNYQAFSKSLLSGGTLKGGWAEMYSLPMTTATDNQRFSAALQKMTSTLTTKGYVYFSTSDVGSDRDAPRLLNFVNKKTKRVFSYLLVREGSRMTLAIAGTGAGK
ncbi:hypothetical protein [Deinococcus sp. QL22]|uniref:hypothetical protein n=1 Tax=Deinococcus sp. QL22 TaxID=2939437 RepID=UPI002016F170|nr:hypothetical protein [Deinococcus sp. QL22]UQN09808.1 hypothetical protein M1R55_25420 [Deinococcus sp. QL22]